MNVLTRTIFFSSVLGATLLLGACSKSDESGKTAATGSKEKQGELKTAQIKPFAATTNDTHDIEVLNEFNQKYNQMHTELEADLKKMLDDGNLTPELEAQRKQDSVLSALTMLKALELKTEQGRYIQGLLYQYWEKQDQKAQSSQAQAGARSKADLITANNQLEYWKSQNSYTDDDQQEESEKQQDAKPQ